MELLFLLPLLLSFAAFEFFNSDDDSSDDRDPVDVETDDEVIAGTSAEEILRGGVGDDFVLGGGADDKLEGGQDDDVLLGEAGADDLYGGIGYDTILGGAGDDTISGGRGQDFIVGGAGDDEINGAAGDDTIAGSAGADKLEGGAGDDLISGEDAGATLDPLAVNFVDTQAQALAKAALLSGRLQDTYGSDITPDDLDHVEAALISAGTDTADDALYGGTGDDTLIGDYGDTLTGGAGADDFVVLSDGGSDAATISDLNVTEDAVRIFVPIGDDPTITLIDGATRAVGVTVVIAGDPVAQLLGLKASEIPSGFIQVINT